ncbi:MAG: hypothetical protein IPP29_21235 [Bacteroidetes bacterium]|nr:hypothetical protein [Bacteroidota bacterium]
MVTESGAGCTVSGTTSITNLGAGDPAPTTTSAGICAGATGTLSASGLSTLNWYTLPVGGTLVNTGPTYISAFPATATYYVESFNGICPSPRTPVTITVTALPSTTPTAVPSAICLGGTSQLDAGTFLSGTLSTPLNQNNGSSATGFDIENISASPVTLHFFQFQSSSILGTVGIQQIWMNTTPMNCTFPTNVTIAPGWVQIANVSTTSAGTSPILTTIPFDVNITIPAGAKFAFAIGGALGQSYTSGVTLCPTPFILGTTPHIRVFQGFGGTLTGTIANRAWNGTVTYQFGDPNLNFAWSPAADLNSSTIKSPIATPTTVGPNPYTVTVTNLAGCTSTATVTVSVVAPPVCTNSVSCFCSLR